MNLPITTWHSALLWFLTAMLLGFAWTLGCWIAGPVGHLLGLVVTRVSK